MSAGAGAVAGWACWLVIGSLNHPSHRHLLEQKRFAVHLFPLPSPHHLCSLHCHPSTLPSHPRPRPRPPVAVGPLAGLNCILLTPSAGRLDPTFSLVPSPPPARPFSSSLLTFPSTRNLPSRILSSQTSALYRRPDALHLDMESPVHSGRNLEVPRTVERRRKGRGVDVMS